MRSRHRNNRRQVADAIVKHLDTLFSAALRLTGDTAEAEDLVQDTCLRAYEAAAALSHPERVKHWLLQIMIHRHIDVARQRARHPMIFIYDNGEDIDERRVAWMRQPPHPTPEHVAIQREMLAALKRALDELPAAFRLAVYLVYVEGLSYQEAAEIMDCPLGSVMSRLARGKSLLRERLRELEAPQTHPALIAAETSKGNDRVPLRVVSSHQGRHRPG
ncbi:MAG: sigma-70 family RNA polymerase sigma factor [Candidatus Tectomicrobia bacterium]